MIFGAFFTNIVSSTFLDKKKGYFMEVGMCKRILEGSP
jgi:hypothetical protein